MEYARLQLYFPDRFGNQKKFAIFERHQFWTSAAFVLALYTAWTLYRIKRPSVSLMESIIIQRMEDAYNEIMDAAKNLDESLTSLPGLEESEVMEEIINIGKDSLETNVFSQLEEQVRNIEINDLLMTNIDKKNLEDATAMYDLAENDTTNSETSSINNSDSSDDIWTDNDCNTVYHVTDEENLQNLSSDEDSFSVTVENCNQT